MDFRGRRHERGSNWTDPEIVELLQLWSGESVQIELESSLRNQRVFDRIAHILRERGIYRTGDQCREKIKKMKLEYRRIKDNHKMRTWKFYDVMDRVLANRPAITYSSQGGGVIAQQVLQNPCGPDQYVHELPPGSFGPVSSGGFLFGHPPHTGDSLDIKCEDVAESMLNSNAVPPEMYYDSGDDQETDGQSLLGQDDTLGRGESSTNARILPSASTPDIDGPVPQDTSEPRKEASHPLNHLRKRKQYKGGKTSWDRRGVRCCSQGHLDKVLSSLLSWQQSAEERLLSMEEARLEKEWQAEEQREHREERRAEQERQHELRLFSMLTGAMVAVRQGAPAAVKTPDSSFSPLAHLWTSSANPFFSSSLSQQPSEPLKAQAVSTQGTSVSTLHTAVKACKMSQNVLATQRVAESSGLSVYLSIRGNSILQRQGLLQDGYAQYMKDKYHRTDNPEGMINLGTSENKLCFDLLHKRLTRPDMLHIDRSLLEYEDWKGHMFLREEVAKFLTHYCCAPNPLKAEHVVVMNGCGSIFSSIAAVICDPKEAVLIPTPFYGVIGDDLLLYNDVKLFHVPLDCEADGKDRYRPFHLTVEKLEEGLQRAKQERLVIRGVILINPHNPLAEIYTLQEMMAFLEFAKRNELHAIVDEVYMLSVFDESVTFQSVLSLESLPDPQRTHVLWGMSKDFGMSGIRIGTLYTENRDLVKAVAKLCYFHGIPGSTQHQVAQLLKDREWINGEYLPENRSRLKAAHSYLTAELQRMDIPFLNRPATFYVWADLRKYLSVSSFEEEFSLWEDFIRHKVVLSCGQAFSCSTPGWFRIVFANEQDCLQLGLKRLREALEVNEENNKECKKTVRVDNANSDNVSIINSKLSPESKLCYPLKEKDGPVPDTDSLATEEFMLLDCQTLKPTESLDSLIGTLRHQIRSSDWLEKNTPELSAGEDPEILDVFKALLQNARK